MGVKGNAVVTSFNDFSLIEKSVSHDWERFQDGETALHSRPVILSSWERSKRNDVDPRKRLANVVYVDDSLREQREKAQPLLEVAEPHMDTLFTKLGHQEIVVTLSDHQGIIISEKVFSNMWNKVEKYQFLSGADWSEEEVGTNAIGTTLIEQRPIQIFSSEHFCEGWHPWVCSSSPIKDPVTNQILGVLNITGYKHLLQAHNIDLAINQAQKIEQNIGLHLMQDQLLPLHSLFNTFNGPVVVFDLKGEIKQFNEAAKYLLDLSYGESIFNIAELKHKNDSEYNIFDRFFELESIRKNNALWDLTFYSYKYGERLLGGMATFEKRSNTTLTNKKKQVNYRFADILTNNKQMLRIIDQAKKAAYSELNTIVYGETGTGKELLVQSIHDFGMRSKEPFVAINCGAIPKELIASELFGYEAGAFTGAKSHGKKGKFQQANKGTIFLDEIGELSLEMQLYLLRVLQEKEVMPIGANKSIPIDVRIICATNKNLQAEVEKGNFREDLYYRLHVIHLTLPPLKERKDDIPLLIDHFLSENDMRINEEALHSLFQFDWPGNIRQLQNCIHQAMFHAVDGLITLEALPHEIIHYQPSLNYPKPKQEMNKKLLLKTLQETKGNITQAAKELGVSRMTIYRKKKEFQIE